MAKQRYIRFTKDRHLQLPEEKLIAERSDLGGKLILEDLTRCQIPITEEPTPEGLMRLLICSGGGETPETNPVLAEAVRVVKAIGVSIGSADDKLKATIAALESENSGMLEENDKLRAELLAARSETETEERPLALLSLIARENHGVWKAGGDRSYSPHNKAWGKLKAEEQDKIADTTRNTLRLAGVAFEDDLALVD